MTRSHLQVLNATNGMVGRFSIEVNGVEAESFFVGDRNTSDHRSNEYMAAMQVGRDSPMTLPSLPCPRLPVSPSLMPHP